MLFFPVNRRPYKCNKLQLLRRGTESYANLVANGRLDIRGKSRMTLTFICYLQTMRRRRDVRL